MTGAPRSSSATHILTTACVGWSICLSHSFSPPVQHLTISCPGVNLVPRAHEIAAPRRKSVELSLDYVDDVPSLDVVYEDVDEIGLHVDSDFSTDGSYHMITITEQKSDAPDYVVDDVEEKVVLDVMVEQKLGENLDIYSLLDEKKLTDPVAVVEAIIGTALSDPDANGSLAVPDLRIKAAENDANSAMVEVSPSLISTQVIQRSSFPAVSKIIKFAIPAIGVWLCSPLLSLIDTGSVGMLSGTAQQAALNPAVAITDYGALVVAFMYTATTNLVASAQESDRSVVGKPRTTKTLIGALQLSGYVGLALGSFLFVFARVLLNSIIGNKSIDAEVFGAAMKYVRIRALGMPAAVVIGSAQSACLGMQDIRSPLYVLLAAAVVNFVGDMLFVPNSNAWIGGAAGAAWATVFSQFVAMSLFIMWLTNSKRRASEQKTPSTTERVNLTEAIMDLTGKSKEGNHRRKRFRAALRSVQSAEFEANLISFSNKLKPIGGLFKKSNFASVQKKVPDDESFSTRGFLQGKFKGRDLCKPPSKEASLEFWPYVLPVTTTSVGRVSSYVAMSHVVSSSLGTIGMAAQQIIISLFCCFTPIADSLNLTAQSFVPGIFEREKGAARAKALKYATLNFLKAGAIFGAAMASAVAFIPLVVRFFTADPTVVAQVNSVLPLLAGVFAVHGIICAGEGLLLGQKDLGLLGKAYVVFFAAVPYFMLRVKKAALLGLNVNITSVWKVFLWYQLARVSAWLVRLFQLQRRTDRQAREEASSVAP